MSKKRQSQACQFPGCGEPEDYYLHRPASECEGCRCPRDHHEYEPPVKSKHKSPARQSHFTITTVHGEGKSAFHVVDTLAPESEQPEIVASFNSRKDAEVEQARRNNTRSTTAKQRAQQERDTAREELRAIVKPGGTVYCVLRHVSRSGMQRVIDLQVLTLDDSGRPWLRTIGGLAARAMGERYDYQRGGVVVGGCGMDMGFHLVYSLGYVLWPKGYGCVGKRCRSNDHSNGDRDYTPHGATIPWGVKTRKAEHWHKDGGYALRHEWV